MPKFKEPNDTGDVVKGIQWYVEGNFRRITDILLWCRDDAEGHGDPADDPERWWSYDAQVWQSWGKICETAEVMKLELTASVGFAPVEELTEEEQQHRFAQVYEIRPRQGGRTRLQQERGSGA